MLQFKECTLTLSSSIVFTFELTFESFKECGGASFNMAKRRDFIKMDGFELNPFHRNPNRCSATSPKFNHVKGEKHR